MAEPGAGLGYSLTYMRALVQSVLIKPKIWRGAARGGGAGPACCFYGVLIKLTRMVFPVLLL